MERATSTELSELLNVIQSGWLENKSEVHIDARSFYHVRDELTVEDNLVFRGSRLVVPPSLRKYVLQTAHEGHLGMNRSKQRAREACFWSREKMRVLGQFLGATFTSPYLSP